jgi:hypothetical protein
MPGAEGPIDPEPLMQVADMRALLEAMDALGDEFRSVQRRMNELALKRGAQPTSRPPSRSDVRSLRSTRGPEAFGRLGTAAPPRRE